MNVGYHTNLKDICKNIADFIFTLDVLDAFTMTRGVRCTCTKLSIGKASKSLSSRGFSGI